MTGVFGSRNQRLLKRYGSLVAATNALEPKLKGLSDEQLRAKTSSSRSATRREKDLDSAAARGVRASSARPRSARSKMRHFDVQLIGGIALHQGKIAEMRTGEGKTLVATLPAYLNALTGKGVHIVTVNEYLAQRDADWMGPVYGSSASGRRDQEQSADPTRSAALTLADITYGTNNEFGFDYLRDNLAFRLEDRVQRELVYAIVDEVDSILIDEARTPLIISGPRGGEHRALRADQSLDAAAQAP